MRVPVGAMPPTPEPKAGPGLAVLSRDEFRVVYGSALSRGDSDRLYERWAIPAPHWALREAFRPETPESRPGAHTTNSSRGPLLLMASGKSRRWGAAHHAAAEARLLAGADVIVFPDRGPFRVIDNGWRLVAEACLSWMDAQEL